MTKAYRLNATGGPEVLSFEDVNVGDPGPGEVRLRQTAVGLNFIDVYHRTGLYPLELPSGIGLEAAGVVEALGEGVTDFAVGDRVAYAGPPIGAYAEARLIPAKAIVKLPDSIEDIQAAGMMLQGMTVEYLIYRTYAVQPGDTVLFHAAAGGVGLIACQWLKQLGATVIGTAGSQEKAQLAKDHGADHVILYKEEDIVARVREITDGAGVPVVYDSVGKDTFEASLDSLAPRGMMVSFGNASGPVPPFDPGILSAKGSLFFTRPSLMAYIAKHEEMLTSAERLFTAVGKGLTINVNQTYPLSEAAEAHRALEARETTGSTVFTV